MQKEKYIKTVGEFYDILAEKEDDEYQIEYIIYRDKEANIYIKDKQSFKKEFAVARCQNCKFFVKLANSDGFVCLDDKTLKTDDSPCVAFQLREE